MRAIFTLPHKKCVRLSTLCQQIVDSDKEELSSSLKTSYEEIHALVVKVNHYAEQIETLTKCLSEECEAKHEAFGKFCALKEQFVVLKHEQGKCNQHLSSCLQKIESLSVSHRLKRREEKIKELISESYTLRKELKEKLLHESLLKKEFDEIILEKEIQISQINETLDCALEYESCTKTKMVL